MYVQGFVAAVSSVLFQPFASLSGHRRRSWTPKTRLDGIQGMRKMGENASWRWFAAANTAQVFSNIPKKKSQY